MAEEKKTAFEILNAVNVNDHTEVKDTGKVKLTYLSWAWAWAEVKKRFPTASYEIIKFDGLPYVYDEKTGFMVYTKVTIEGVTHEMWLPVMDGNNRAMLDHPYEVKTKYNSFTVQAATMFDVNKTIMRCLTKNLAMFGLGLYIYAGEDLPEEPDEDVKEKDQKKPKAQPKTQPKVQPVEQAQPNQTTDPERQRLLNAANELVAFCKEHDIDIKDLCVKQGLTKQSTTEDYQMALVYAKTLAGGEGNG
jgi:hypothetical protein